MGMRAVDYMNKCKNLERNEDPLMHEEYMTSMSSMPYYQDGWTDASNQEKVSRGQSIPWHHS